MSEVEPQPPEQIDGRVLGVFNSYTEMILCLKARVEELRIAVSSPDVARVTGLADSYVAKVLAPSMSNRRRLGLASMQPVLSVLGCKLALIEDKDALARYTSQLPLRNGSYVHGGAITVLFSRRHMRKIGKIGAEVRWSRVRDRRAKASRAARARWAKARADRAGHGDNCSFLR